MSCSGWRDNHSESVEREQERQEARDEEDVVLK